MPLYTYVITFKGDTYISQSSHSNFRGFISWADAIPNMAPTVKKELSQKAHQGEFSPLANKKHVWRKSIEIGDEALVVHAIQTQL